MTVTNVAVVGYGYWGTNLVRNVNDSPSCNLLGIIDSSESRRLAAESSYPDAHIWSRLEDALADDRLDAVVIASPATEHSGLALQCLSAGRHVLVEKPMAMTTRDAEAIRDLASSAGLTAMAGHTFLYSEPVRLLHQYIAEGRVGKPLYLYSQRLNLGRIRHDCNALWNFAPHDIAVMLYLLKELPIEVSSRGISFLQEGIDDVSFATLKFPSGIAAHVHVSWLDPRKVRLMTVVGSDGMIVYDDVSVDQKITVFDSQAHRSADTYSSLGEHQWLTRAGDVHMPRISMVEPLKAEIADFVRACQTGQTPVASAQHATEVVKVLCGIDESARRAGTPISLEWS